MPRIRMAKEIDKEGGSRRGNVRSRSKRYWERYRNILLRRGRGRMKDSNGVGSTRKSSLVCFLPGLL